MMRRDDRPPRAYFHSIYASGNAPGYNPFECEEDYPENEKVEIEGDVSPTDGKPRPFDYEAWGRI